jgi:hypothetical protein
LPNKGLTDETALEKLERLLAPIEADVVDESDPIQKANALMEKVLRDDSSADPLLNVPSHLLPELAERLNIDRFGKNALSELRKAAGERPGFVAAFLNEPTPAKTLGVGASHTATKEQLEKASPYLAKNSRQ